MVGLAQRWDRDRIASAAGVAALHALLGYAFIVGLGISLPQRVTSELKLFNVLPEPPPPPVVEKPHPKPKTPKKEGAAAPQNLKSQASPVVAPKPAVRIEQSPPVTAAPIPRLGSQTSAGAAPVPGPGTGAGGNGNGFGSGGAGEGEGGGGDGTPPRWKGGRIKDSDYPDALSEAGVGGTVSVAYDVGADGRVSGCEVTHSSGNAELDQLTCRLIEQRFRYKPSLDENGRPVESTIVEDHTWVPHPRNREEASSG